MVLVPLAPPPHALSQKRGISIQWQELFPIYLACILWGLHWSGKRIACGVTTSLVAIINSKHSMSPQAIDLVRATHIKRSNTTLHSRLLTSRAETILLLIPFPVFRRTGSVPWLTAHFPSISDERLRIVESTAVRSQD